MASRRTPSTGALESFCEFFSCMQLEYCMREPLSKFEGLSTFYCNFISVAYMGHSTHSYYTYYRTYNIMMFMSADFARSIRILIIMCNNVKPMTVGR